MVFDKPRRYVEALTEDVRKALNFYDGEGVWRAGYRSVPEKTATLFCVHWTHLEIYNGGFWQYFWNSTGVIAPEAVASFERIGMPDVSVVIREAMDRLGPVYPRSREARQGLVGEPEKRMDLYDLDGKFYDLADTPKIFFRQPRFVEFADRYYLEG